MSLPQRMISFGKLALLAGPILGVAALFFVWTATALDNKEIFFTPFSEPYNLTIDIS